MPIPMPLRHSLSLVLASLLLFFTAGFYAPQAALADDPVRLPIEVLGADGHTETVTLHVDNPASLNRLWLRVHRPGYRDQLKNPARGAKASVRLNDGSWIDLTNETATIDEPDARFGGIGGEARTVRFSVPVQGVRQGANTVTFRFNGTDGLTSGYRVLALNFLRGGPQGAKALPQSAFAQDDPADWESPLNTPSDIAEGERLWRDAALHESDLKEDSYLAVSCAGCHAEDGSDLKYFAYSNKSIQARAEFHGLSAQQGRQIASYLRSLKLRREGGAEYEAPGRPWNPPYQPGPGLDDKPVEAWAAGAGLDNVLDDDADMLSSIFPGGITKEAIAPDQTMSVTEQPIAMQLPDWNDWLPEIHPEDVWGDYFSETASIDEGPGKWRDDVLGHYQVLRNRLESQGVPALIQRNKLDNLVGRFTEAGIQFFLDNGGSSRKPNDMREEDVVRSIRHWTVVKLWEVSRQHSLGDEAPQIYGANGDDRSWLGQARSAFELAPDLAADNGRSFRYQTLFAGKYASTAWYQLQLLLNSGNGSGGPIQPIDWSYHPAHVNGLYAKVDGPAHPLRQTQAYAKLLQLYHTEAGLDGPFNVRQLHPVNYVLGGKYADAFEEMNPSTRPQVYGALLGALMDEMDRFSESDWNAHRNANDLQSRNYTPKMVGSEPLASVHHQGRYADAWYSMIPIFDEDGVDADVLNRVVDWGEMMWPRGNWEAVRPQGGGGGSTNNRDNGGSGEVVAAVNAGGRAFTSADGTSYAADTGFEGGSSHGENVSIDGTEDDALYQTERYGDFSYAKTLENGSYEVTLQFAEIYWDEEGARIFDVALEERAQISNLDLYDETGANRAYTATHTVEVTDGALNIAFNTDVNNAKVSALLIRRVGGGSSPALQAAHADQAAAAKAALSLPTEFALTGNYPNPFRSATTIQYALPEAADVKLEAFDALGRRVAVLVSGEQQAAGHREVRFDAAGMAPGVYFVRLKAGDFTQTQKVMLVR